MRLDKYIATVTDYSRTEAKKLIKQRRVTVDEAVVNNVQHAVLDHSVVMIGGELLRSLDNRYFMLHKPKGYVSATKDRQHLTVLELLDGEDNLDQLHIAGRLDIDTTGLLLITDDGQWSHRVTSPKSECSKTYWLETADPITQEQVDKIETGIKLDNEKRITRPAVMELMDEHSARLTIHEGKYHQVKRMLAAVGNKVDLLHREQIGSIALDSALQLGEYRQLTQQEVDGV